MCIYCRRKVGHAHNILRTDNTLVYDCYFNWTNKCNLIGGLQYFLARFFNHLAAACFFMPPCRPIGEKRIQVLTLVRQEDHVSLNYLHKHFIKFDWGDLDLITN